MIRKVGHIVVLLVLVNCSRNKNLNKVVINPNPSSEMAILMREMSSKLETIKPKVENNEILNSNLLSFDSIHLLRATDISFEKSYIKSMSVSFANSISEFNIKPSKSNYSTIINSCINCHQQSCPGPMTRINKLLLNPWSLKTNLEKKVCFE